MQTTRWIDMGISSLNESIEKMLAPKENETGESNSIKYGNWITKKAFDNNQTIVLNESDIEFNCILYSYDKIMPGNQPLEDRTQKYNGFVIVYYNGVNVNYIIDKYANAMFVLRKILGYKGKKEIEKNDYTITSDLFLWMIKKVYGEDNELEQDDGESLSIDSVIGFKGDAEDMKTTVSARGESVMNLISTLSFFLEGKRLNQIKIGLQYSSHANIDLVLSTKPTVEVIEKKYLGIFSEEIDEDMMRAKLYLLTYVELVPRIMQTYYSEIENGLWNSNERKKFYTDIGTEITNKISEKVDSIQ